MVSAGAMGASGASGALGASGASGASGAETTESVAVDTDVTTIVGVACTKDAMGVANRTSRATIQEQPIEEQPTKEQRFLTGSAHPIRTRIHQCIRQCITPPTVSADKANDPYTL
ncbi:MAG: hypothetical protein DA446_00320 [Bacteroidetes bacterium]|nr:MAG: hypothetical protein DA446_00320 [Bacteroidota bacterium]